MKKYFVIINRYNKQDKLLGKTVCFQEAETEDEAIDKAWAKHGSISNTLHCCFEITEEENYFTVLT